MTEVKPANLGDFGVADYLTERISVPNKSVKDCSERITEQSHRLIFQMAEKWWRHIHMVRHHYCRTCVANGVPKKLALSVLSVNL